MKDRIINIFKYDPYHDELISLLDLLLYEDKENEFIEFLINEMIDYKNRCNNSNVRNYIIKSGLILYKILNDIKKLKNEYYNECYNEIYNRENNDKNYFILYQIFIILIMIYTKFRFIFYSNTFFNYT